MKISTTTSDRTIAYYTPTGEFVFDDGTHVSAQLRSKIKELFIQEGVTTLPLHSLDEFYVLEDLHIPTTMQKMQYHFSRSGTLKRVHIVNLEAWFGISFALGSCNPLSVRGVELYVNDMPLESLITPTAVTHIHNYAFYGASCLQSVTIMPNVTTIALSAFEDCSELKQLFIGAGVTTIWNAAFAGCTSLEYVYYGAVNVTKTVINNSSIFLRAGKDSSGIELEIGSAVEQIPALLFAGSNASDAPKIKKLTFEGDSYCKSIASAAFEWNTALEQVEFPYRLSYISSSAFANTHLQKVVFNGPTEFNVSAFSNTPLGRIEYKSDLGEYPDALKSCTPYYEIAKFTYFGIEIENGIAISAPSFATEITFPDFVYYIDSNFAAKNVDLKSIHFPSKLKRIGSNAFCYCVGLSEVDLSSTELICIEEQAFLCCYGLDSVKLPNTVTIIGDDAFRYCYGVTDLGVYMSLDALIRIGIIYPTE